MPGMTQSVVAKTGVATVEDVKVPNPVLLAPYRTFVEVEQPESSFVFRMKDGPSAALFEADGGAWRNDVIANVLTPSNRWTVKPLKKFGADSSPLFLRDSEGKLIWSTS
ncbi:hypothetical protein D3C74_386970 [compost metagenome]